MKFFLALSMLIGLLIIDPVTIDAADEQRQAYDKMVEESVKEADEYVQQKQKDAADEYARQRDGKRRSEEAARIQEEAEEQKVIRGVIVRTPPRDDAPEAVTLPSGPGSTGESGAGEIAMPAAAD